MTFIFKNKAGLFFICYHMQFYPKIMILLGMIQDIQRTHFFATSFSPLLNSSISSLSMSSWITLENTQEHVFDPLWSWWVLSLLSPSCPYWHKTGQGRASAACILTGVLGLLRLFWHRQSSSWQLLYWGVYICFADMSGYFFLRMWDQKL